MKTARRSIYKLFWDPVYFFCQMFVNNSVLRAFYRIETNTGSRNWGSIMRIHEIWSIHLLMKMNLGNKIKDLETQVKN